MIHTQRQRNSPQYLLLLPAALILIASCRNIPEESLTLYLEAQEYYKSGAFEEARQRFAPLSKRHRSFHQAAFMEGKALFFLGDAESAAAVFQKLNKREPGHFDSAFWYARCLVQLEQRGKAEAEYLRLLSCNSQDPRIFFQLALICLEQERIPDGIEYLRKSALFGEELAMMLIRLGRIYYRYGLFDSALEELGKAQILLGKDHPLDQPIEMLMEDIREEAHNEPE